MKFRYGGKYCRPSRRNMWGVLTTALLVLVTLVVFGFFSFGNRSIVYQCPGDELPVFTVPEASTANQLSRSAEDIVDEAYAFSIETKNGTFEASCPFIQADFGKEFNEFAISELRHLSHYVQLAAENGEPLPATKFSYEAYYADEILTVILLDELPSEDRTFTYVYDVELGREVSVTEISKCYLGLSYTEFLCVTGQHIAAELKNNQSPASAQLDPVTMVGRCIFPSEDGLYLLYDLPLVDEDSSEVRVSTVIESADVLSRYSVTPTEAVREILFATEVSVMGGDDQIHANLVRTAFFEHPNEFITVATEKPDYAVTRLLLYASKEEKAEIIGTCDKIQMQNHLSAEEAAVINLILSNVIEDNEGSWRS